MRVLKNSNTHLKKKTLLLKSGEDLRDALIISTGVELTFEGVFSHPSEHFAIKPVLLLNPDSKQAKKKKKKLCHEVSCSCTS